MERSSRWHRIVDRCAHIGWMILVVSVTFALLSGAAVAVWNPDTDPPPAESGGGGMPGVTDVPIVVPFLGYGLALLLGVPSALVSVGSFVRGRWSHGFSRLLIVLGPLLFLVGMEIVPHVVNPCLAADLASEQLPRFCERTESGPDITGRLHALNHPLVGALPMVLLYQWALHRWRPDVLQNTRTAA